MLFKNRKRYTGVDIGHHSVKVVVIKEERRDIVLEKAFIIKLNKDNNHSINNSNNRIKDILCKISQEDYFKDINITSISSEKIVVKTIKLPEIEESAIKDTIKLEYENHFPFSLSEAVIKYSVIGKKQNELEILTVFVPEIDVKNCLELFEGCGIKLKSIGVQPLALANLVRYNEDYSNVLIADIGQNSIQLVTVIKQNIELVRLIRLKRNRDMRENYTDFVKDKKGKENYLEESVTRDKLIIEIERVIDYFKLNYKNKNLDTCYLCGGGAYINNLQQEIHSKFKIKTKILKPFENINFTTECIEKSYINKFWSEFSVSFGLSLGEFYHDTY